MDQTDITKPSVQNGPGYSFAYSSYIHTTAWVLRKLVALMTGDGTLFDETFTVETPGLGEGKVSCSVCIPKNTDSMKDVAMPLLIVLEGGGFVLGQPSDGERFDRMLSDRVSRSALLDVNKGCADRFEISSSSSTASFSQSSMRNPHATRSLTHYCRYTKFYVGRYLKMVQDA